MRSQDRSEHARWIRAAVERHEGPLVRYATQITGDIERGRDVVQDTFLRMHEQDRAQLDGHLTKWLYRVCRNRALDVRRKEQRMKTMSAIDSEGVGVEPEQPAAQEVAAENRETTSSVLRFVEGLPENQREVVRLKFQNGLTYREISEITELSVSNVGYLIHTAIKTLRSKVGVVQ